MAPAEMSKTSFLIKFKTYPALSGQGREAHLHRLPNLLKKPQEPQLVGHLRSLDEDAGIPDNTPNRNQHGATQDRSERCGLLQGPVKHPHRDSPSSPD